MSRKLIKLGGMDSAIMGISSTEDRLVYHIPTMIEIIMDDFDVSNEEATEYFEENINKPDPDTDAELPIFIWDSPYQKGEVLEAVELDKVYDNKEIRKAFNKIAMGYPLGGAAQKNLTAECYKLYKELHKEFIDKVKVEVDVICQEARGVDVMLDLMNLLKRME